jgi:hypothetical protein
MNRGVQVLRGEIRERGDQVRLAKRLQRDQAELSRVLSGQAPSLSFRQAAFRELQIEMHWWEEPVSEELLSSEEDDEPTLPELPVLLAPRRTSSFPPPPPAPVSAQEFQRKSRDWFDQVLISKLTDAAAVDDDTLPSELPSSTPGNLPPVATQRPSERDRTPTDPDPRAGDVLEPTPKPLTALDLDFE